MGAKSVSSWSRYKTCHACLNNSSGPPPQRPTTTPKSVLRALEDTQASQTPNRYSAVPLRQSCEYTPLPPLHCHRSGGSPGAFRSVPLTGDWQTSAPLTLHYRTALRPRSTTPAPSAPPPLVFIEPSNQKMPSRHPVKPRLIRDHNSITPSVTDRSRRWQCEYAHPPPSTTTATGDRKLKSEKVSEPLPLVETPSRPLSD